MRAVLDTVVFVRALINPRGKPGRLLYENAGKFVLVLSPEIVREILEVINRPQIRRRFPTRTSGFGIDHMLATLQEAEVVEPRRRVKICRDPNDDKFIECAVEGTAGYIVSEDDDLLAIVEYEGIRIVSAAEFVRLLSA